MEYKWSERVILSKLREAVKARNDYAVKFYYGLLKNKNITKDNYDVTSLAIMERPAKLDYCAFYSTYYLNFSNLPKEVRKQINKVGTITRDRYQYQRSDYHANNRITYSDDDLVTMTHDLFLLFKDPRITRCIGKICNPKNHMIQIIDTDDYDITNSYLAVKGITTSLGKETYVEVFRDHTITDFRAFVHECFHAIRAMLYGDYDNERVDLVNYFAELEGRFGDRMAAEYLRYIKEYRMADNLRIESLYNVLQDVYLNRIIQTILSFSNGNRFDMKRVKEYLSREANIDIKTKDDLTKYMTINGFDAYTNVLSYLIVLDIFNNMDVESMKDYTHELFRLTNGDGFDNDTLKNKEGINLVRLLTESPSITFMTDNLRSFREEYKAYKLTK